MLILIQTIFITINLIIGLYDFSFYRIPNVLLGALLVSYVLFAPMFLPLHTIVGSAIVCLVVLAVTFALFAAKIIGGGDAKYLTVISLWMGTGGVLPFIFIVTIIGGVMAILYLVLQTYVQRLSDFLWIQMQKAENQFTGLQYVWIGSGVGPELGKRENIGARMLPYGVAIAIAAITIMANSPLTVL